MNSQKQQPMLHHAHFRFYAGLNHFLSATAKQQTISYGFTGTPAIKDSIEAMGVPHVEVALILCNGISIDFDHPLHNGDYVSVFPVFKQLEAGRLSKVQPHPLEKACFILDVHLGKLARKLRMLGFDTLYRNDYPDEEIVQVAADEQRIVLTRDRGILKNSMVTHGYCLRSDQVDAQIAEVLDHFDLHEQVRPFQRCISCNGTLTSVDKEQIKGLLPSRTRQYYSSFYRCSRCGKLYWPGSHYRKMCEYLEKMCQGNTAEGKKIS